MAIHGETLRPTWRDMLALAHPAGIDERAAAAILEPVRAVLHTWTSEAQTYVSVL